MDDPKLITNSTGDQKDKMTSVSPAKRTIVLGVVNTTGMKSTNLNRKRRWDQPPEEVNDMPCVKKVHLSDCPVSEIESPETSPCINPPLDRISDVNSDLTNQCDISNSNELMSSADEFLCSDNAPCEGDTTRMETLPNSNDRLTNPAEDSFTNVSCSEQNECESTVQEEKSFEFSDSFSDNKVNSCSPQQRLGIFNPSMEGDTPKPVNDSSKIVSTNNSSTVISHQSDELRRIMSSYNESSSDSNMSDTVSSSNVCLTDDRLLDLQGELQNKESTSENNTVCVPSSQDEKVFNERLPFKDSKTLGLQDSLHSKSQLSNEKSAFTVNVLSSSNSRVNEKAELESHNIPIQKDVDIVSNKEASNSDDDYLSTTQSPYMNESEDFQNCLESNPDFERQSGQSIKNLEKESEILVQNEYQDTEIVQRVQSESIDGVSSSLHIPKSNEYNILHDDAKSEIRGIEDDIGTNTHLPENIDVYDRGKEHANERNFDNAENNVSSLTSSLIGERSSIDLKVCNDTYDVCVKNLNNEVYSATVMTEYNENQNDNSGSSDRINVNKTADSDTVASGCRSTVKKPTETSKESLISTPNQIISPEVKDIETIYSESSATHSNVIKDSTIEMNYSNDDVSSNSLRPAGVKEKPLNEPVSSSSLLNKTSFKSSGIPPDACNKENSSLFEIPLVNSLKENSVTDDLEKSFDSSPLNNNHMLPTEAKDLQVEICESNMKEISENALTLTDEQKSNSSSEDIITPSLDQSEKSSINVTSSKNIDPEVMEVIFGSSSGISRVVGNENDDECLSVPSAELDSISDSNIRLSEPNSPVRSKEDSAMEVVEERPNLEGVLIVTDEIVRNEVSATNYLDNVPSIELLEKSEEMGKEENQLSSSEISTVIQPEKTTSGFLVEESPDDNSVPYTSVSSSVNEISAEEQLREVTVHNSEKLDKISEVKNLPSNAETKLISDQKDEDPNTNLSKTSQSITNQSHSVYKAKTEEKAIEGACGISKGDTISLEDDNINANLSLTDIDDNSSSGSTNKDDAFLLESKEVVVTSKTNNLAEIPLMKVAVSAELETSTARIAESPMILQIETENKCIENSYIETEKESRKLLCAIDEVESGAKSDDTETTTKIIDPETVLDTDDHFISSKVTIQEEVVGTRIITRDIESSEDVARTTNVAPASETPDDSEPKTSLEVIRNISNASVSTLEVIETSVDTETGTNSEVKTTEDIHCESDQTLFPAECSKPSGNIESKVTSEVMDTAVNIEPEATNVVKDLTTAEVIEDPKKVELEIMEITENIEPENTSKVIDSSQSVEAKNVKFVTSTEVIETSENLLLESVSKDIETIVDIEPEKNETVMEFSSSEVIEASDETEPESTKNGMAEDMPVVVETSEDGEVFSNATKTDTPEVQISGITSEIVDSVEDAVHKTSEVVLDVSEDLESTLTSELTAITEDVLPEASSDVIAPTDELELETSIAINDTKGPIETKNSGTEVIKNVDLVSDITSGELISSSESFITEIPSTESTTNEPHQIIVKSENEFVTNYEAVESENTSENAVEVIGVNVGELAKTSSSGSGNGSVAINENISSKLVEKPLATGDGSQMKAERESHEESRISDDTSLSKEEESSVQLHSESFSLPSICENQEIGLTRRSPNSLSNKDSKLSEENEKPIDFISDTAVIEDDFKETPDIQSYSTELNEILDESKDFVEPMDIADSVPLLSDEANLEPVESSLATIEDEVLIHETKSSEIEITARINSPIEESSEISFEPIVNDEGTKGLTEDIESYDVVEEVVTCESPESDKILENELEGIIDDDDDNDDDNGRSPSIASEETLETVHESVANSDQLEAVIENDTSDLKESDIDNQNEVFIESEVCIGTDSLSSEVLGKDATKTSKGLLENELLTNSISSDFLSRKRDCMSTVNSITKPQASFLDEAMEIEECDDDSPPEIKKRRCDSDAEKTSFSAVINAVKIDSKVLKEKVSSDIPLHKAVSSPIMQKHETMHLKNDERKSSDKGLNSGESQSPASKVEPITLRLYKDNLSIKIDELDSPKRKSPKLSSEIRSQLSPLSKGSDSKCALSPQTKQLEFTLKIAKDVNTNQTKATMSPKSNMSPSSSWKLDPESPSPSSPAESGFSQLKLKISKPSSPVQTKDLALFEKTTGKGENEIDSLHLPKQPIEIGSVLKKMMESEKTEIKKEPSILEKALSNSTIETPNSVTKKRGRPRKALSGNENEGNPLNHSPPDPLDSPLDTSGESGDQGSSRQVRSCRARTLPIVVKTRKPRGGGVGRGGGRGGAKGVARPITSEKEAEKIQEKLSEYEKAELAKIEARKEKMRLDRIAKNEAKKAKKLAKKLKDEERRKRIAAEKAEKAAAAAPQVFEEETRMSAPDSRGHTPAPASATARLNQTSETPEESQSSINTSNINKKGRMEIPIDPESDEVRVDQLAEYQWQGSELCMIQEQVSLYLGVKSFKRKYPDLKRRTVEAEERTFLEDSGLVPKSMCDLGLTAVSSAEVLDVMYHDFPDKYEEFRGYMREKESRELSFKQKALSTVRGAEKTKGESREQALEAAALWNLSLNRERRDERRCSLDLQTFTVHYPKAARDKMVRPALKPGLYPVPVIPGQFSDYYKTYTPTELMYFPLNTVMYGPLKPNERRPNHSDGSDSSSSSSDDSSASSCGSDSEDEESISKECKICNGEKKTNSETHPEILLQCSQCKGLCHPTCQEITPEMLPHIKKYSWHCSNCKKCVQCRNANKDEKMLFCDLCDRGYHISCVGLKKSPESRWHCSVCSFCTICGSKDPGGAEWHYEYKKTDKGVRLYQRTLCVPCSKNALL